MDHGLFGDDMWSVVEVDDLWSDSIAPAQLPKSQILLRHGGIILGATGLLLVGPQSRPNPSISQNGYILLRALSPADWHGWLQIDASSHADRVGLLPDMLANSAHEVMRFAQRADSPQHADSKSLAALQIEVWLEESINRAGQGDDHRLITLIDRAIRDPEVMTAQDLCLRTGLNHPRQARICKQTFGFTPKLLLCRERFLRSFISICALPRGAWAEAIDPAYVDQSHFIRDAHRFLGMCPSDYLARVSNAETGVPTLHAPRLHNCQTKVAA